MAARVVPADIQQIHHFVSTPFWARSSLEHASVKGTGRRAGHRRHCSCEAGLALGQGEVPVWWRSRQVSQLPIQSGLLALTAAADHDLAYPGQYQDAGL